jgi:hypothetical protein
LRLPHEICSEGLCRIRPDDAIGIESLAPLKRANRSVGPDSECTINGKHRTGRRRLLQKALQRFNRGATASEHQRTGKGDSRGSNAGHESVSSFLVVTGSPK